MPQTDSPLRYPGGKTAIAPFLRALIRRNGLCGGLYVEPYAGGAGAALALLFDGTVGSIHINDKDPHIHAFWEAILVDAPAFLELMETTPVDMENYARCQAVYRACDKSDSLGLGFATFFLNRCNTSGVLAGGPIGGKAQTGRYKLNARFQKPLLKNKIQRIWASRNRIRLTNLDALELLAFVEHESPEAFVYLDPPYYKKGKCLYLNFYKHADHLQLSEAIQGSSLRNWLISYDLAPEIEAFYHHGPDNPNTRVNTLNYSLRTVRKGQELLIKSPMLSWE